MEKLPVREISGEVFAYESEYPEKVQQAFETFFPKKAISRLNSDGAFGTKIVIFRAKLAKKPARELAEKILASMTSGEKEALLKKLDLHLDEEGSLYLRFDKQFAFEKNKIKFTPEEEGNIQIVLSLEAFPANAQNFKAVCQKLLQ
ncbi:MAG: RNA-binding domain-containing protein [Candidatus Nanoarchaeia archaeon]|nr:RNA-binding domain-containing protein [Candidatus Nanoarchaeia archaeon]MDD5239610.1 RNA-binding domain-containing protein [Candidatus Nanoarchaeia archaeon]